MKIAVDRTTLIEKLRENRETHRSIFEEALTGYQEKALEELESKIEAIRSNGRKPISLFIHLPAPEDHTDDYDRVIGLLEWGVDDVVNLDDKEYANYVNDDWNWKQNWLISNSAYSVTAASLAGDDE